MKTYLIILNTIFLIIILVLLNIRLKTLDKYINNVFSSKTTFKQQKKFKYMLYFITILLYLIFNYFIIYIL